MLSQLLKGYASCQICKFVREFEDSVIQLNVSDILEVKLECFLQAVPCRAAWISDTRVQ